MKKIGLIALALVLALGAMGAGLAYWNETLTIEGTVNTGIFDMEFTDVESNDPDTTNDPEQSIHVASCNVATSGPKAGDGVNEGLDGIQITISNAYPCYSPKVDFTVHNRGTIPAKIVSVTISDTYSNFKIGVGDASHSLSIASGNVIDVDLGNDTTAPDGTYDLRIVYTGVSADDVLNADGTVVSALTMHVWESGDEGSDATENASGSFTITIPTIQSNAK